MLAILLNSIGAENEDDTGVSFFPSRSTGLSLAFSSQRPSCESVANADPPDPITVCPSPASAQVVQTRPFSSRASVSTKPYKPERSTLDIAIGSSLPLN